MTVAAGIYDVDVESITGVAPAAAGADAFVPLSSHYHSS